MKRKRLNDGGTDREAAAVNAAHSPEMENEAGRRALN